MKLSLRAKQLTKKLTLLSTAFVLAVSTLTASVPFILSSEASAQTPEQCAAEFNATTQRCVRTLAELQAALAEVSVSEIVLNATITTPSTIVIDRPVKLNGHDERIILADTTPGWNTRGQNYVLQVYNTTGVTLNSVQFEGADAGLLVNGSEVTLTGNMRFVNHEFGNIELSKGSGVTRAPKLHIRSANSVEGNINETTSKPYVWVDTNSVNDTVVNSPYLYRGVNRSVQNPGQHWYFANVNNTGVVADIAQTGAVFGSVQEAVDAAAAGQTVRVQKSSTLPTRALVINKAITLEGNNHTLTAGYSFSGNSSDNGINNTVIVIASNGVRVNNLTTDNTSAGLKPHGIVVDYKNDVALTNVTLKNGRAGMIVSGSQVTVTNIATVNNSWYGINVDRTSARLTVLGTSAHSEGTRAHIYSDNRNDLSVSVNDVNAQYVRWWDGPGYKYVLDLSKPTVTTTLDKVFNPSKIKINATDDQRLSSVNVSIYDGSNTNQVATWGDAITTANFEKEYTNGLSTLSDGTYIVRATASDILGKSTDAENVSFTIDRSAPVAKIASPGNGATVSGTVQVTGVVEDANPMNTFFSITGPNNYNITETFTDGRPSHVLDWNTVGLADGVYTIQFATRDRAQNKEAVSTTSISVTVDNTAPVVTVDTDVYESTTPTITGTVNDPGATVVVTINEESFDAQNNGDGTWSYTVSSPLQTGASYPVTVTARDSQGNTSPAQKATITLIEVPTIVTDPTEPNPAVTDPEAEAAPTTPLAFVTTPTITGPLSFASILGDSTTAPVTEAAEANDEDVRGVSTLDTVAQAVDADNTDGKAMGLAWYWWLLIAAAVALIGWWIAAAVRNRQANQ